MLSYLIHQETFKCVRCPERIAFTQYLEVPFQVPLALLSAFCVINDIDSVFVQSACTFLPDVSADH